ncbi:hypothetical protein ABGE30_004127 [Escherichia coli]
MKLVFVPLKDVFKECKGKRQFSIKKDAYRRFSSVSNEMQIGIKKIAALYKAAYLYHHAHGAGCLPVSSVSAPEPAPDKGYNQPPVADMPLRTGGFTMPVSFNKYSV